MKIFVVNWALHKSVSWHWALFETLHEKYGYEFTIISGKKMWAPRGGFVADEYEEGKGIKCYRVFEDIPNFRDHLADDVDRLICDYDIADHDMILCFHQANFMSVKPIVDKTNVPLVLLCEQAFRTSGAQAGELTPRWKEILRTCEKILTWSSVDVEYEDATGAEYVPFGGCLEVYPSLPRDYDEKVKEGICIYQGSLTGAFKNCVDFNISVPRILERTPVKKMVIQGYILEDGYRVMINELKRRYGDRVEYRYIPSRAEAVEELSKAFVAYTPMKGGIMSNFPIETFAMGVPAYMPFIREHEEFKHMDRWQQIEYFFKHPGAYRDVVDYNRKFYLENNSCVGLADHYYRKLEDVV